MSAVNITFIGGPECGDVGSDTWGNAATGQVVFPLNKAVRVDPEEGGPASGFLAHVVKKARTNRFYIVEDAADSPASESARVTMPIPPEPARRGRRSRAEPAEA